MLEKHHKTTACGAVVGRFTIFCGYFYAQLDISTSVPENFRKTMEKPNG